MTAFSAALAAIFVAAGDARAETRFDRDLDARPIRELVVDLPRGQVEVVPHPRPDRLRIRADARGLGASTLTFEMEQRASTLRLRGREAHWLSWLAAGPQVRVRIWVPPHVAVALDRPAPDRPSSEELQLAIRP